MIINLDYLDYHPITCPYPLPNPIQVLWEVTTIIGENLANRRENKSRGGGGGRREKEKEKEKGRDRQKVRAKDRVKDSEK